MERSQSHKVIPVALPTPIIKDEQDIEVGIATKLEKGTMGSVGGSSADTKSPSSKSSEKTSKLRIFRIRAWKFLGLSTLLLMILVIVQLAILDSFLLGSKHVISTSELSVLNLDYNLKTLKLV
jgi:cytoskeletal protein RodZ